MASSRRTAKYSVITRLQREPFRFSFVQAVRLLDQAGQNQATPKGPIGGNSLPRTECVQLASVAALSFPPTEIISLHGMPTEQADSTAKVPNERENGPPTEILAEQPQEPTTPKLTVGFMGLFGPCGVLPHHDTQRIIDAGSKKNPERDFLDVFNHRILSLFYRASIKYRLPIAYEAAYRHSTSTNDAITRAFYSLAGMGTPGLRGRLHTLNEHAIEFCGYFGHQPKNVISLQRMLGAYFQLNVSVEQFVGQWMHLSEDNISAMPSRQQPLGKNSALGQTFILGERVWDVSGKFRVRIGPLNRREFESFLPGTDNLVEVAQIAQLYAGNQFDFDVQLELLANEVPPIQLGGNSRLGLNTWLFAEQPIENKKEAIFTQSGLPQLR